MSKENKSSFLLKPFFRLKTCTSLCRPEVVMVCSCNDYIRCEFCRGKRRRRNSEIFKNKVIWMQSMVDRRKTLKLLTLTFARTARGLKTDLECINKAFTALKRRALWKKKVIHWVAVKEIVQGNIHFHIVLLSDFLSWELVASEWKELTGNFIVDIRKVSDLAAIDKLSSYLVKDTDPKTKEEMAIIRDEHKKMRFFMSSRMPKSLLVNKAINRHVQCKDCKCPVHFSYKFKTHEQGIDYIADLRKSRGG